MAKKSKVAKFLKKRAASRPQKVSNARRNPTTTALQELGATVGTGVGAYVFNRVGTGVVKKMVGGRLGALGSHVGPLASVIFAGIVWYLAERWAWLRRYQNSVIVGSGLAVFQTLLNRYLPGVENLLNAASTGAVNPRAVGEYIEEDDDLVDNLPGASIAESNKLISAVTDEIDVDDLDLNTGVFARN